MLKKLLVLRWMLECLKYTYWLETFCKQLIGIKILKLWNILSHFVNKYKIFIKTKNYKDGKAKSFEHLAGFYEACASVEIDEYRDYDKVFNLLN